MRHTISIIIGLHAALLTAQAVVPVLDSLRLSYADTLYFESGKWALDSAALLTIQQLPYPESPKDRIYLTGHTDAIGALDYNEDLAQKRAQATRNQLLKKSWSGNMILIQTFGERSPVASNETDEERQLNRRVRIDLFRSLPYMKLKGKIIDSESGQGIPNAQIRLHSRSFSDSLLTNNHGEFQLDLPLDAVVGMDVFVADYFFKTQMMKIHLGMKPIINIPLQKAIKGAAADLSKLYFVGNKAILLDYSNIELPKIKRFLDVNNHLKVEIAGHVNYPNKPPVTEDTFEWDLSVRRAQFLHDWLLEKGIPADQITYKGYGNHEMRYPHARTTKEQELNRRVEIRITGTRN